MRLQLHTLKRELEELLYNRDSLTRAHNRIGMLTKLHELQELVNCVVTIRAFDAFFEWKRQHGWMLAQSPQICF